MQEQMNIEEVKQEEQPKMEETNEAKVAEETAPVDPAIQAVMFLQAALPAFRIKLDRLFDNNRAEVKRVLSTLVESPLEQETRSFTTEEAEDLFKLGSMIQNAKFILFTTGLRDEKIAAEVESAAKEAGVEAAQTNASEEAKQGDSNGN